MTDVSYMSTPQLVREFAALKVASAVSEEFGETQHNRLGDVVRELRNRGALD